MICEHQFLVCVEITQEPHESYHAAQHREKLKACGHADVTDSVVIVCLPSTP